MSSVVHHNTSRPLHAAGRRRNRLKVAWLCGAYEAGCDGVGDYVRAVTGGLRHRGGVGRQAVVALRDAWVSDAREEEDTLRLPANWPVNRTVAVAAAFLDRLQPDVLAWNFVPQMFAPRGLISARMADAYAALRQGRRLIIFMHELWCGTGREDTVRNWVTGAVQRRGVLYWLRRHAPDCVLTSNLAYASVLQHHGIGAATIPLCSNIGRTGATDRRRWPDAFADHRLALETRSSYLVAGVFGAIHPVWKPEAALVDLAAHARREGRRLAVVWFGRGSSAAERLWRRLVGSLGSEIAFVHLGALDEPAASELLENCELGLPTIQFNLLGKSGTAAAFLEHGVPLLVASDEWTPRHAGFESGPAVDWVVRWTANAAPDWARLFATRGRPISPLSQCLDGWAKAIYRTGQPSDVVVANLS